tara:strand:- start:48 stop:395 length:348 start_codon:yes stop_codon:yes gene_type:complete
MNYKKNVSEPWFSLIKLGLKKCEGRLNKGDFSKMKKGDKITFINNEFGFQRDFSVKITSIHNYDTFNDYLKKETLEKCLPGINTIEEGTQIYYKYYTKNDEISYKIIAIRMKVIK